ncbi:VanZ family protein [Enterococcus saccharolyticus]|uniref:VanZ/RDD domain-containing protein n=1 Tax=Candidatus Enterococcus willemsii TaxID=1857215 RepID=A0ABQ6YVW7_9ENTE|nr:MULTISPECIES: VanZ family protein [Enterococcus]KAF1301486.1 hypothetical protein BAU17_06070 [Enterococcus sp. CU12B]MCD5003136.1 VanZ family protein [Enterococcus saccharolyticus]
MSAYIEPIKTAMLIFPFLALAISSIFFIIQYRRYGRFIFYRALILYSFIFYLLCAYLLVILPLPPISEVATYTGPQMELHLGASWQHFMAETVLDVRQPATYLPAMKQSVFLEPMFNILITVPFGMYLRYYFKKSLRTTIALTFCLTLFFELTQLSGLYFIYPRSYRLFDVNDLLHNTLGGLVGYAITPLFTFLLPTREEMDERSFEAGKQVTYVRRAVAWLIDWAFLTFLSTGVTIIARLVSQDYAIDFSNNLVFYFVEIILYFMFLPTLTNGQTLGKKAVRIRLIEEGQSRIRFRALAKRYGLLYLVYVTLGRIGLWLAPSGLEENYFQLVVMLMISLLIWLLQAIFVLNIAWSVIRKKRQLFYEKRSHTQTISTIEKSS